MLVFTQGDHVVLTLYARDKAGDLIDLTGATFETKIKGPSSNVTLDDDSHAAAADQVADKGKFTLTITSAVSATVGLGAKKDIKTKITQSGNDTYVHGEGILTVKNPLPEN